MFAFFPFLATEQNNLYQSLLITFLIGFLRIFKEPIKFYSSRKLRFVLTFENNSRHFYRFSGSAAFNSFFGQHVALDNQKQTKSCF